MEQAAAEILWKRSVEAGKMRYTVLLSDGDASVFSHLTSINPYPGIAISKEECVNHVGKRLGKGLTEVVNTERIKGVTLGGKKEGSLTSEKIIKLQNYYTAAIRENAPNVPKIKTAIEAIVRHCSSTDEKSLHAKCPAGVESWCFFNRAMAKNEEVPSHRTALKTYLRTEVAEKIMPVFVRLSTRTLLERCVRVGTQNSNESLHHSIWSRCPKSKAATFKKLQVAAVAAIAEFSMGCEQLLKLKSKVTGVEIEDEALKVGKQRDQDRERRSVKRSTEPSKRARKARKMQKQSREKRAVRKEGPTYVAGGFL